MACVTDSKSCFGNYKDGAEMTDIKLKPCPFCGGGWQKCIMRRIMVVLMAQWSGARAAGQKQNGNGCRMTTLAITEQLKRGTGG